MNFEQAIEALKSGSKIARSNMKEKGIHLELIPEDSEHAHTDEAKQYWSGREYPEDSALIGVELPEGSHIAAKTSQGHVVPWWGSQEDSAAEDWITI